MTGLQIAIKLVSKPPDEERPQILVIPPEETLNETFHKSRNKLSSTCLVFLTVSSWKQLKEMTHRFCSFTLGKALFKLCFSFSQLCKVPKSNGSTWRANYTWQMFTVQGAKLLGFWQCDVLFPAPPSVPWTTSTFLKSTFLWNCGREYLNVLQFLHTRYFTRGRVPPPRTMVVKRTTIKVVVTSTFLTWLGICIILTFDTGQ